MYFGCNLVRILNEKNQFLYSVCAARVPLGIWSRSRRLFLFGHFSAEIFCLVSDLRSASFLIPIWVQSALSRPRSSARTGSDFPSSRADSRADVSTCFPGSVFGSAAISRSQFFSICGAVAKSISIVDPARPLMFFFSRHFLCDFSRIIHRSVRSSQTMFPAHAQARPGIESTVSCGMNF
jgi:hypothetical protein